MNAKCEQEVEEIQISDEVLSQPVETRVQEEDNRIINQNLDENRESERNSVQESQDSRSSKSFVKQENEHLEIIDVAK